MKALAIVLGTVALALVLVAGGLWVGNAWAQGRWDTGPGGWGMMGQGMSFAPASDADTCGDWDDMPCSEGWQGYGQPGNSPPAYGMMGQGMNFAPRSDVGAYGDWDEMPCSEGWQGLGQPGNGPQGYGMMGPAAWGQGWEEMPCGGAYAVPEGDDFISLDQAHEAIERYVDRLGDTGLHVTEVMEFEQNFYAIVAEDDTGIGAMELLVNRASGAVGPEPGPNMMWNAKYGMHHGGRMGMMGGYPTDEMTLSPQEAEEVAQRWLDTNLPGRTAGEPDPFYGYYTLHFLKNGKIEGMLSVHGSTGDVWYHSWHGDFVAMVDGHD